MKKKDLESKPIEEDGLIDPYWLAYFILSPYSYTKLVGESTGTTVTHVNLADFRPHILLLSTLAEQRTFKKLWVSSELYLPYSLNIIRGYKETLRNSKKCKKQPISVQ